ncbi:hypothetical protein CROQUDRAFT_98127 [Cronartium quercuum f. sp. fusiforme G11]|uniref:Endonuclease/exonuclease/phosphatase domain-containing protein n=1 Tax=Cronartium quercuum f. sp. fusiforme G11 TaxID=708437 RepID=A0A9P6T7I1_9BASI|nr:hypothetical protein CROQUDRAFT_98127 [Cronartium quercuum f. sp. fusiforme G11]
MSALKLNLNNHPKKPHHLTIISAYAPPKQSQKLNSLPPLLANSQHNQVLVRMDSNFHHALWNPPNYLNTHVEADNLIQMMAEAGLELCSEPHIPTFYPTSEVPWSCKC